MFKTRKDALALSDSRGVCVKVVVVDTVGLAVAAPPLAGGLGAGCACFLAAAASEAALDVGGLSISIGVVASSCGCIAWLQSIILALRLAGCWRSFLTRFVM